MPATSQAAGDEPEVRGNRERRVGAGAVELRDLAVGLIGGHLAVDLGQDGIDVRLQPVQRAAVEGGVRDADGIGGAHGAAGEGGGAVGR